MKTAMAKSMMAGMFGILVIAGSTQAAHAQIVVGQCMGTSPYNTIQSAVSAAPSGSTIKVCPGGYPEQVVIEKPLTLEGITAQGNEGVLVVPPSSGLVPTDPTGSGLAPQILVTNATGVTISNLIVDAAGNNSGCGGGVPTGILFHNASGTAQKLVIRNQVPGAANSSGCNGYGFYALNDSTSAPNTVTLQSSDIRNQSFLAVTGEGSGLTFNTLNNFIAGPDNSPFSTFGITYLLGPKGTVQGNTVVNEADTAPNTSSPLNNSVGIYMLCSNAAVTGNTVSDTQLGIYITCLSTGFASNETVSQNKIFETKVGHGIYVSSVGNSITNNVIVGSSSAGILIDSKIQAAGNTVSGNTITEACVGIDLTGAMGTNKLSNNTFNAVYVPTQKNAPACGPIF